MLHDFTKDKFDILILAGQSNAEGYGFGPTPDPYQPDGRVFCLHKDGTLVQAAERVVRNGVGTNLALSFAREYLNSGRLAEGRRLLIVSAAVGGTGFRDGRWGLTDDLFLWMLEMARTALSLNPENRLVALLWHQGETDAIAGATRDEHYHNLSALVSAVRGTLGVPALPVIAGDFTPRWRGFSKYKDACPPITEAIRAVMRDCGHGGFVETDGLTSNAEEEMAHPLGWPCDEIHFSRRALYELGRRYFERFTELQAAAWR